MITASEALVSSKEVDPDRRRLGRHVDQVRLPPVQEADALQIQVDSAHHDSRLRQLDREAKADVSESDHAHARSTRLELFAQDLSPHGLSAPCHCEG
jgi:hypothetical protein